MSKLSQIEARDAEMGPDFTLGNPLASQKDRRYLLRLVKEMLGHIRLNAECRYGKECPGCQERNKSLLARLEER